jgi:hypothetical protein
MIRRRPLSAASNPRKTVGPRASMSSSALGRLVTQDKDLEVHGDVTGAELGEELDGAAQGQVGKSLAPPWRLRGGCSGDATCGTPRSKRTPSSRVLSEYPHPTGVPDADQPVGVLGLCVERVGGDHGVGEVQPVQ